MANFLRQVVVHQTMQLQKLYQESTYFNIPVYFSYQRSFCAVLIISLQQLSDHIQHLLGSCTGYV